MICPGAEERSQGAPRGRGRPPYWFIYALGGGFGHLTRAAALARRTEDVRILTNSPYVDCVRRAMPELDLVAIEAREEVGRQIELADPDCLIVDTFPRGLGGELAEILPSFRGRKVLVQRDLNPRYAAAFDLEAFIGRFYDLVLNPGEGSGATITEPWLVRSPEDLLTREAALELLGLDGEKPCAIVCAAGNRDELDWYEAVASHLAECPAFDVRLIATSYWPAMDLYPAADVVIGGAGYNTIYECLAMGVPLVARPWPRKYDRQELRANRASARGRVVVVDSPLEAASAALGILRETRRTECRVMFHNGAEDAAVLISGRTVTRILRR
jgi:hypothetical protein